MPVVIKMAIIEGVILIFLIMFLAYANLPEPQLARTDAIRI